jgi:hypothetical protein
MSRTSNSRPSPQHNKMGATLRIERAKAKADLPERPERPPEPPPTPEELAIEQRRITSSVNRTHGLREAALEEPCDEHGATAGVYCWPGAKGVCNPRIEAGMRAHPQTAFRAPLAVGELKPLADATRQARRDARIRDAAHREFIQRTEGRKRFRV